MKKEEKASCIFVGSTSFVPQEDKQNPEVYTKIFPEKSHAFLK